MHFSSLLKAFSPSRPAYTSSGPSQAPEESDRFYSIKYQILDPSFGTNIEVHSYSPTTTASTAPQPTPPPFPKRWAKRAANLLKVHHWKTVVPGHKKPWKELIKRHWLKSPSNEDMTSDDDIHILFSSTSSVFDRPASLETVATEPPELEPEPLEQLEQLEPLPPLPPEPLEPELIPCRSQEEAPALAAFNEPASFLEPAVWQDTRRLRCYRPKCRTTEYASCSYCSSLPHISSSLKNLATAEQPGLSCFDRASEERISFFLEVHSRSYDYKLEEYQASLKKDSLLLGNWW